MDFETVADAAPVTTSKHTVRSYFRTIEALYNEIVEHEDCKANVAEEGRALGYGKA